MRLSHRLDIGNFITHDSGKPSKKKGEEEKKCHVQYNSINHASSSHQKSSDILRRNTIIPHPLIHERILRAGAIIRHLDIIIHHIIPLPILAHIPRQLPRGDAAQIRRQPRQVLDIACLLVDRCACVVRILTHEDILRDGLPCAFAAEPDFVVVFHERFVFGDGGVFGDEPRHVVDFILAIVFIPEAGRFRVPRGVVLAHDLGAVVLPCRSSCDLDSLCRWGQLAEAFHEGAADDGSPAVWRLHHFDVRVDVRADGFAEVGILAEAADHEHGVDALVGRCDLAFYQGDDFLDNRLEYLRYFSAGHTEFSSANALRGIVC